MNIANSRALLLSLIISLFTLSLSATNGITEKAKKDTKKDLIIVNIDPDLSDQLAGLANYTFGLYKAHDNGMVSIKRYVNEDTKDQDAVNELIVLLKGLGVGQDRITISDEKLALDKPYFTLSVSAGPNVQ